MNRLLIKSFALCIVFGVSLQTACAQAEASPENGKGASIRAVLLVPAASNMELVTMVGERISEPFNVGSSGLGQRIYPGAAAFALGVKDEAEETGFRSVGKATLPPGGKDYILLLEPVEGKYFKLHIISATGSDFASDATLFFNASGAEVGVILGSIKKVIAPRKVEIISAPPKTGDVPFYQVQMYHADGSTPRMFASSRWLHRDDGRNYVFVYREPQSGKFSYKTFHETISKAP